MPTISQLVRKGRTSQKKKVALSVYITSAEGSGWSIADQVDHNITKVVSGIATTALKPELAVAECIKLIT